MRKSRNQSHLPPRRLLMVVGCLTLTIIGCDPYPTGNGDDSGGDELPDGPGKELFLGQGGCHVCHGSDAQGSTIAPNLTDDVWLTGDGSLASIREIIDNGVPDPVAFPSPMPPRGGRDLTDEQVDILAEFVFDISH